MNRGSGNTYAMKLATDKASVAVFRCFSSMPLTIEEFETLFQYFAPPGKRDHSDKRVHWRVQTNVRATIIPLASGKPLEPLIVRVIDASRRGVRFVHTCKLSLGDQFLLCLVSANFKHTRAILCAVRRCESGAPGSFKIGCEFLDSGEPVMPTDSVMRGLKQFQKQADAAEALEDAA
jgi:hypothetical protein